MVVRDHEIDAHLMCSLGRRETSNSTVDRHDHLDPHRFEAVDPFRLKGP